MEENLDNLKLLKTYFDNWILYRQHSKVPKIYYNIV